MSKPIPYRMMRALLFLFAAMILLGLSSSSSVAQASDCHPTLIECVEKNLRIDLEVEAKLPPSIVLLNRYLIYWHDGLCQYRQVVIVVVRDLQALEDIMTPLGSNKWNAMGQIAEEDYKKALANGVLLEIANEPVEQTCNELRDDPLPPCELPWGPIVIDAIPWPDEDIMLYSGLVPVKDPQFCFSYNLDGPRILEPVKELTMPFFFTTEDSIKEIATLLRNE